MRGIAESPGLFRSQLVTLGNYAKTCSLYTRIPSKTNFEGAAGEKIITFKNALEFPIVKLLEYYTLGLINFMGISNSQAFTVGLPLLNLRETKLIISWT